MQPVESTERKELKGNRELELEELQNSKEPSPPELLMHNSTNSTMRTNEEETGKNIATNDNNCTQSNANGAIEQYQLCNTGANGKKIIAQVQENTLREQSSEVNVHKEQSKKYLKENNKKSKKNEKCINEKASITSQLSTFTAVCTSPGECKGTEIQKEHEQQRQEQQQQQQQQQQEENDDCRNQRINGSKQELCVDCQKRALMKCKALQTMKTASRKDKTTALMSKVQKEIHDRHEMNQKEGHDNKCNNEEMWKHEECFIDRNNTMHSNNTAVMKKRKHNVEYLLERKSPICTTWNTSSAAEWVQLNVGGTMFITTLTTLEVEPQSVLAAIASNLRKARLEQEEQRKEHLEQYVLANECSSEHYKRNARRQMINFEESKSRYHELSSSESESSSSCLSSLEEMQHTLVPASEESRLTSYTCPNNNNNDNKYKAFTNTNNTSHERHTFCNSETSKESNAFSVSSATTTSTQIHHEGEVQDLHNCHCIRSGNNSAYVNTSQKTNTHSVDYDNDNNEKQFSSFSPHALSRPFLVENRTMQNAKKGTLQSKNTNYCTNNMTNVLNVNNNNIFSKYNNKDRENNVTFSLDHDACNSILLDVDAQYFAPVLNYLRHGTIAIPAGVSVEGVRAVAEYLNVFKLAHALTPPIPTPRTHIPRRRYLFSWGQGSSGELGSQLLEDVPVPTLVQVTPFKEHVVQMSLGANYTLTRTNHGNVYSFGHGSWGQLGLGNPTELEAITGNRQLLLTVPHRIAFFERHPAMYIASGYAFAMAITCDNAQDYHVYFWGNNNHGQSGLGPTFFKTHNKIYTPQKIEALEHKQIIKVCGGSYFSLALSMDGSLYSWGNVECLGLGTPREVEDRFAGTDILAKSWNNEKRSVLLTPQRIHVPIHPTRQRAVFHSNTNNTLSRSNSTSFDRVNAHLHDSVTLSSRETSNRTSIINELNNNHSNENEEHSIELRTPVLSRMPSSVTSTSVLLSAQSHEIAEQPIINNTNSNENVLQPELREEHEHNESNEEELYESSQEEEELSSSLSTSLSTQQAAESQTHLTLLSSEQHPEDNSYHKEEEEQENEEEEEEEEEVKFNHINTGQWHSAAISTMGHLYTWGVGYQGRLGHGSNDSVYTPTLVQGALTDHTLIDVACGSFHTVALTSHGLVFCWGDNDLGQCGVAGPNQTQRSSNGNSVNSPYNESAYVSPEGLHRSLNALEAIMTPYRVIGLELIAGGVARGISCGRRHTAILMSGPQPSCTRDCCCTCENNSYHSEFSREEEEEEEEEVSCYCEGDNNDNERSDWTHGYMHYSNGNRLKNKQKENNKKNYHHHLYHYKCKTHSVIKSSASHGQVYVFGGVDVVNPTLKHFNNNSSNEENYQYNANNIYNSTISSTTTTAGATVREQRRRNSTSNNINSNHEVSNHNNNNTIRSYIHREVASLRPNALYNSSLNSYAPRQTRSLSPSSSSQQIASPSLFTRPREQHEPHPSPTQHHHRPIQSHLLHYFNNHDEQVSSELQQDEQIRSVQFSSMAHQNSPLRSNTNAENNHHDSNENIMYTFSGNGGGGGGSAPITIHNELNLPHHSPNSTLVSRPCSQYKRIQGLEQYNITHVMCGLYHTFVFAEDTLPYYETPIDECTSSAMSALTSLPSSNVASNKVNSPIHISHSA